MAKAVVHPLAGARSCAVPPPSSPSFDGLILFGIDSNHLAAKNHGGMNRQRRSKG